MKLPRLLVALTAMTIFSNLFAEPLKVGDSAPGLSATADDGSTVSLAEVYPKGFTLVYFYPKADTPGCTKQGCSLRDAFESLTEKGVTVFGVSTDDVEAQRKFREKYNLPFRLLADTEKEVCKAFGVPTTMGFASRQAFLVGKDSKIVWADHKASTEKQAEDVLNALKTLSN